MNFLFWYRDQQHMLDMNINNQRSRHMMRIGQHFVVAKYLEVAAAMLGGPERCWRANADSNDSRPAPGGSALLQAEGRTAAVLGAGWRK